MENFVKVMTAGLAVFAVLLFIGWSGPLDSSDGSTGLNTTLLSVEKIGTVGFAKATPREIMIGNVNVGNLPGEDLEFEAETVLIKNGLFSKNSQGISFNGERAQKATLSFRVDNSNEYGRLVIKHGELLIYNDVADTKEYSLEIYDLNDTNALDISATSSGIKFWAPTTYVLSDIKLTVDRYADRDHVVPFQVYSYESSGWSIGRISFVLESKAGSENLSIEVNGKPVYSDSPAPDVPTQIDFSRHETRVSPGENLLSFKTGRDSAYIMESTRLTIFYYGTGEAIYRIQPFELSEFWKSYLMKENVTGVVNFYVRSVPLDSGLDVVLNNQTHTFETLSANTWYNITFSEEDLSEDTKNFVKFYTHGNYDLGELNVLITSPIQD
ncbi:MAG: hypothetical protein KAJ91_01945 [Candidatus Aenigmarchaeota archaeon]|nr:hypothetical protein [Candidatus Aenigmarchaeota archaeon]